MPISAKRSKRNKYPSNTLGYWIDELLTQPGWLYYWILTARHFPGSLNHVSSVGLSRFAGITVSQLSIEKRDGGSTLLFHYMKGLSHLN